MASSRPPGSPITRMNGANRRGSITSLSSRAGLDRETVSQALDDIHASASRSSGLTAFNDFAPPPSEPNIDDRSAAGPLGTFYSRFKSSLATSRSRPGSAASNHAPSLRPPSAEPYDKPHLKPSSKRSDGLAVDTADVLPSQRKHRTQSIVTSEGETQAAPAADTSSSKSITMNSTKLAKIDNLQPAPEVQQGGKPSNYDGDGKAEKPSERSIGQSSQDGLSKKVRSQSSAEASLISPRTAFQRGTDSFLVPDVTKTKSTPFASVTNLNVPASSLYDLSEVQTDASSARSMTASPALTRSPSAVAPPLPSNVMHEMRRKVLSRDFWMKDENAKVCFSCGDAFTTFRRKHHCRTCGQIYDAKCTVLISGKMFDQPGRLRICRICENIIMGDESSEDMSEGDDQVSMIQPRSIRFSNLPWNSDDDRQNGHEPGDGVLSHHRNPYAASRRVTGATAQDVAPQMLTRPSSSRSLKSMSNRPRSSSHKVRRSRHQHIRSLGTTTESGAPFQKLVTGYASRDSSLPAFHTDAIVDPDIAPFMSDEGTSEDDMQNMDSVLHGEPSELQTTQSNLSSSLRKPRPRQMSSRSQLNIGAYDNDDAASITSSRPPNRRRRVTRTHSMGSIAARPGTTQRLIRSENLYSDGQSAVLEGYGSTFDLTNEPMGTPLIDGDGAEPTPRRASLAELDNASMRHVKGLLKQLLEDSQISNSKQWRRILISILLRCAEDVDPNIQRGDDIDIRHYVKLKKAPGRKPADSFYLSGVVFSKNVALKGMPRSIQHARILIVSFPIVYARHRNHFMSLDPVIAQESEYLKNLVRRILALKPSVVLAQHQVAGVALDFLRDAGVTVVCNVKETVLHAVARCTQTYVVSSVDQLTMDSKQLGRCDKFEFHTLIFNDIRKTYAFVSGCAKDLGCTIVLRGSHVEELRRIKRITEFMAYVVYNLKLETSLIRDQFMSLSDQSEDISGAITMGQLQFHLSQKSAHKQPLDGLSQDDMTAPQEIKEPEHPVDRPFKRLEYEKLVEDLKCRILSISPAVRLPPPFLLLKAQEQERQMRAIKENLEKAESMDPDDQSEEKQKIFQLLQPEMIFNVKGSASEQLRDSLKTIRRAEFERASNHFIALKRRWESYISGALDPFSPLSHQQIVVLYSIVSTPSSDACEGPDLIGINFYQEHDIEGDLEPDVPLGEYVERLCDQSSAPCTASHCDQLMINHHRQYVHGEGQVSVHVKQHASKLRGLENTILMWSVCRECGQETPVVPMSRNSWKFSFAKYMELTFWSRTLKPRAGICPHDVQRKHIRYFGFSKLAVSIQYDPVRIMEVMVPRNAISWNVEKDVQLKNSVYQRVESRMKTFLASVRDRLRGINLNNISPELIEDCRQELDSFWARVNEDEDFVINKLQEKYTHSKFYEIIPLNRALRAMQERVSVWGGLFADFERKYLPSEQDIRKLAAQRLKDVYFEREELGDEGLYHGDEKQVADADWARLSDPELHEIPTGESLSKQNSPEHAIDQPPIVQHLDLAVEEPSVPTSPGLSRAAVRHTERPNSSASSRPESSSRSKDRGTSRSSVPSPSLDAMTMGEKETVNEISASPGHRRVSSQSTASSPPLLRSHTQPSLRPKSAEGDAPENIRSFVARANMQSLIPVPAKSTSPSKSEKVSEKSDGKAGGLSKVAAMPTSTRNVKGPLASMIPRSIVSRKINSRVSAIARQFEQMTREFEREKIRERRQRLARVRQTQVYSVGSYQPIMEVYRDAHEAVQEQEPILTGSKEASHDVERDDDQAAHERREQATDGSAEKHTDTGIAHPEDSPDNPRSEDGIVLESDPTSDTEADIEHVLSDTERTINEDTEELALDKARAQSERHLDQIDIPKDDKTSLLKLLSSFWSERSASGWLDLEYPLRPTEHIFSDSDVIPREDEPSSVIAFSLASDYYHSQLQAFRDRVKADPTVLVNPPSGETEIEQTLLGRTATHVSYTFPAGMARMRCKVFFAESFDAIQQKCGVSERIVESLSRCFKFDSKGGKTKSIFLKTLDERFVLKSLSQVETDAFLRFAPDYFDYMSKCLFHNLPSALAKMLGFYEVTIKNPETGVDFSCFLQLMENVFYEGPSNQTFDLKGSMRNRRVKTTGEKNEVLLDENLLDYISSAPIYIRNHSNSQMASSISNDTLFCSKQNVMDYSLIVGLYDDRQELMVGIIDYIRTYTWDKKLESWIKDRGKNKPTVRSPKEYRNRFRASISRYFPLAPSCWQIFGIQRTEQPPLAWWDSLGHRDDVPEEEGLIDVDGAESEMQ